MSPPILKSYASPEHQPYDMCDRSLTRLDTSAMVRLRSAVGAEHPPQRWTPHHDTCALPRHFTIIATPSMPAVKTPRYLGGGSIPHHDTRTSPQHTNITAAHQHHRCTNTPHVRCATRGHAQRDAVYTSERSALMLRGVGLLNSRRSQDGESRANSEGLHRARRAMETAARESHVPPPNTTHTPQHQPAKRATRAKTERAAQSATLSSIPGVERFRTSVRGRRTVRSR